VTATTTSLLDPTIARAALLDAMRKLDPRALLRNPVILSVWVVSVLVSGQLAVDVAQGHAVAFELQIAIWLWLTVLFANFAEALAEGRGKAQAESLRKTRTTTIARFNYVNAMLYSTNKAKMSRYVDDAKKRLNLDSVDTSGMKLDLQSFAKAK